MRLIYKSPVDLLEIYEYDDGQYVLEITDFGHDLKCDKRIIPQNKLPYYIQLLNAKESCELLSRNRKKLKKYP